MIEIGAGITIGGAVIIGDVDAFTSYNYFITEDSNNRSEEHTSELQSH